MNDGRKEKILLITKKQLKQSKMKEEIRNIIETAHTDMGYKFLCITETDVPETITRLHRLFLQNQIEMLKEIKSYAINGDKLVALNKKYKELQNQLDNE